MDGNKYFTMIFKNMLRIDGDFDLEKDKERLDFFKKVIVQIDEKLKESNITDKQKEELNNAKRESEHQIKIIEKRKASFWDRDLCSRLFSWANYR